MSNKLEFQVEVDGTKKTLAAVRPTVAVRQQAQVVKAKSYAELVKGGALLEAKIKDVVKEQGLWNDEKEAELAEVDRQLREDESLLPDASGKVRKANLKLSDLRAAAIRMRGNRFRRVNLLSDLTSLRNKTAEGLSDNAEFDFLVSKCIVDANSGEPFFASTDDYRTRASEPYAISAANRFFEVLNGVSTDFEKELPENRFLLKHGLCNGELALTDKAGNKVGVDGKPIEKEEPEIEASFEFEDDLAAQPPGTE